MFVIWIAILGTVYRRQKKEKIAEGCSANIRVSDGWNLLVIWHRGCNTRKLNNSFCVEVWYVLSDWILHKCQHPLFIIFSQTSKPLKLSALSYLFSFSSLTFIEGSDELSCLPWEYRNNNNNNLYYNFIL